MAGNTKKERGGKFRLKEKEKQQANAMSESSLDYDQKKRTVKDSAKQTMGKN